MLVTELEKMEVGRSLFQKEIRQLPLTPCSAFRSSTGVQACSFQESNQELPMKTEDKLLDAVAGAPDTVGQQIAVLFSGGPAAGGHNVIVGIKHALGSQNTLWGVRSGPKGLMEGDLFEVTDDHIADIVNSGGFDFLGSDRTKIKTDEQFAKVKATVEAFNLNGIIVVGGDDSNTNAAFLADYLQSSNCWVAGVPKTIDGDLQVGSILPISFGFDTATKVYAEVVGNILQDAPSSQKYWHFVKLMGRSASHVALEVALQTHPHVTLISEEVAHESMTLMQIVQKVAMVVAYRASKGLYYGVVLVPEGLIEFVPELRILIDEINAAMADIGEEALDKMGFPQRMQAVQERISASAVELFNTLPDTIQQRLLLDRDSHGNLKVSQIPTEELLMEMVNQKVSEMQHHPDPYFLKEDLGAESETPMGEELLDMGQDAFNRFLAFKFSPNNHFFGYEGRCGAPSRFDANYTYNLGLIAGSLILNGKTGYMAGVTDFDTGGRALAIPLNGLITTEIREGKETEVIKKALVEIESPAFRFFVDRREKWSRTDRFCSPGPIQFWGSTSEQIPVSVALNQSYSTLSYQFD